MYPKSVFGSRNVSKKFSLKKKIRNVQKNWVWKTGSRKVEKSGRKILAKKSKFCTQKIENGHIWYDHVKIFVKVCNSGLRFGVALFCDLYIV